MEPLVKALVEKEDPRLRGDDKKNILSVSSLSLSHFRNYHFARIELSPQPVVLTGRNGAGKTNILEALSLLTPGRGLRRAKLSELEKHPLPNPPPQAGEGTGNSLSPEGGGLGRGNVWAVAATACGRRGEVKLGTGRDPEALEDAADKRIIKIDGKPRPQAELAQHMAMVWLTPQMEQLFNDGASAGRKFLDRLVYSFDPDHASRVNEYEFAMRERNKLLQFPNPDADWLDALEQAMAETGAAIAQARLSTAEHINTAILHSPLSFPKAQLGIHGFIEERLTAGHSALQAEEEFKQALASARRQDASAGRTLAGIHRSEMHVTHTEKNMPAESCSTGEQKAVLLSIVLAQARCGERWHRIIPVLLLDEVVAHLDAVRRGELFDEITQIGAQVWMTGTDHNLFDGMRGRAQFLRVDNGHIGDLPDDNIIG